MPTKITPFRLRDEELKAIDNAIEKGVVCDGKTIEFDSRANLIRYALHILLGNDYPLLDISQGTPLQK